MSEIEIKQMQEKINAGILLARKRLIEKTKKEDGELVVVRDGKVVRIKARLMKRLGNLMIAEPFFVCWRLVGSWLSTPFLRWFTRSV